MTSAFSIPTHLGMNEESEQIELASLTNGMKGEKVPFNCDFGAQKDCGIKNIEDSCKSCDEEDEYETCSESTTSEESSSDLDSDSYSSDGDNGLETDSEIDDDSEDEQTELEIVKFVTLIPNTTSELIRPIPTSPIGRFPQGDNESSLISEEVDGSDFVSYSLSHLDFTHPTKASDIGSTSLTNIWLRQYQSVDGDRLSDENRSISPYTLHEQSSTSTEEQHFEKGKLIGVKNGIEVCKPYFTSKRAHMYDSSCELNKETSGAYENFKRPRTCMTSPYLFLSGGVPYQKKTEFQLAPSVSILGDDEFLLEMGEEVDQFNNHPTNRTPENSRECPPVPLLTPPGSPVPIILDGGCCLTTYFEWSSNLTVDIAMQSISELKPLSPTSLELLEMDEEYRVGSWLYPKVEYSVSTLLPSF